MPGAGLADFKGSLAEAIANCGVLLKATASEFIRLRSSPIEATFVNQRLRNIFFSKSFQVSDMPVYQAKAPRMKHGGRHMFHNKST